MESIRFKCHLYPVLMGSFQRREGAVAFLSSPRLPTRLAHLVTSRWQAARLVIHRVPAKRRVRVSTLQRHTWGRRGSSRQGEVCLTGLADSFLLFRVSSWGIPH